MNEPSRHHYLAESYLNRFCNSEGLLAVYDKLKNEYRYQQPKNTTVIKNYYRFEQSKGESHVEIEKILSEVESEAKTAIDKIDKSGPIDDVIKGALSPFIAFQWATVPAFQKWSDDLAEKMTKSTMEFTFYNEEMAERALKNYEKDTGEKLPVTPEQMSKFFKDGNYKIEHTREHSLKNMMTLAVDTMPIFPRLNWQIFVAPEKTAFITCDNPFCIIPPIDFPSQGILGVGILTRGALKILPLSAKSCLVLGDPGESACYRTDFSRERIRQINIGIASNSERFVIARDRTQLERIMKEINSKKVG